MRWRMSAVNTPIGVSAGSAMRSSAAHDADPRIGADRRPRGRGPRWGRARSAPSARADLDAGQQVQRLGGDVGPAQVGAVGGHEARRQPGPVGAVDDAGGDGDRPLERLVGLRAVGHVLVEQHDAALQALDAVLADLQRLRAGRRPPVDRPRLVAVDVVAQAVEVAGPEPLGQRQQVAPEHALAEQRHVQRGGRAARRAPPRRRRPRSSSGPARGRPGGRRRAGRSSARRAARSGCGSRR